MSALQPMDPVTWFRSRKGSSYQCVKIEATFLRYGGERRSRAVIQFRDHAGVMVERNVAASVVEARMRARTAGEGVARG